MHAVRAGLTLALLMGSALAVTGCQTHQADLRLAATQGSGLGPALRQRQEFTVKRGAEGRSTAVTSILFIPTSSRPSLLQAIERAVENGGGGAALSASVDTVNWWFGVSVSQVRVRVTLAQIDTAGSPPIRSGQFAALSNDFVRPRDGIDARGPRVTGVEGETSTRHILWIPTDPSPPRLEDAIAIAIESGVGDLLVDADVEYTWWTIPFVYGVERWRVTGDSMKSAWVDTGRAESAIDFAPQPWPERDSRFEELSRPDELDSLAQ